MKSNTEGLPLWKSISFVENWITELTTAAKLTSTNEKKAKRADHKSDELSVKGNDNKGGNDDTATAMSRCCFAVGKVIEVRKHPESNKLYIEKVDLGPELNALTGNEPRTILSGLQEFVKEEDFLDTLVLVIANLEPRKIAGIPSHGMVLCASTEEVPSSGAHGGRHVVPLKIPEGTRVGERVVFDNHDGPYAPVLKKKLAKNFEEIMAEVRTNEKGEVCWGCIPFKTSVGVITAPLRNAQVS